MQTGRCTIEGFNAKLVTVHNSLCHLPCDVVLNCMLKIATTLLGEADLVLSIFKSSKSSPAQFVREKYGDNGHVRYPAIKVPA